MGVQWLQCCVSGKGMPSLRSVSRSALSPSHSRDSDDAREAHTGPDSGARGARVLPFSGRDSAHASCRWEDEVSSTWLGREVTTTVGWQKEASQASRTQETGLSKLSPRMGHWGLTGSSAVGTPELARPAWQGKSQGTSAGKQARHLTSEWAGAAPARLFLSHHPGTEILDCLTSI